MASDPTLRPLQPSSQALALVSGLVTECAVALLLSILRLEAVVAGVTSLACGVAVYAWRGGFQRDRR